MVDDPKISTLRIKDYQVHHTHKDRRDRESLLDKDLDRRVRVLTVSYLDQLIILRRRADAVPEVMFPKIRPLYIVDKGLLWI